MRRIRDFLERTCGVTTIEWVAVCAIVLLAAFGISNMVMGGTNELGKSVAKGLRDSADDIN
jgi:hypothetical protein